ncbi:MAG: CU044_2847 family protein [Cyanobacteria bacterium P01_H01_bin.35]
MKQIVEFPLEDGDSILIEVDAPPQAVNDRIGITDNVIHKANKSLDSAMEKIKPVANTIIKKVRSMNEPADEVEVKFGIKLSAEMGAIIASGEAEVNYEITLKWHNK